MSEYHVYKSDKCEECNGSGRVRNPFYDKRTMQCRDCNGGTVRTLVSLKDALIDSGIIETINHDMVNKIQISMLKKQLGKMKNE